MADGKAAFEARGWLKFDGLLDSLVVAMLPKWVDEVSRPPQDGVRLHYYEQTAAGRTLCRTERYIDDHACLKSIVTRGPITEMASKLLGEPSVLYKEKINYKAPGGGGFAPHQDATAYPFVNRHVTCVIAVDPMTEENGCLEFARGVFDQRIGDDGDGCLRANEVDCYQWDAVPAASGSVIFFTSHIPHRSANNRSANSRRAIYLTYNALSEGNLRGAYYRQRAEEMQADRSGGAARISNIGHFKGHMAVE